ncbi:MAG: hypothetical protein AVDCRST_MAG40-2920, partial [uncultured Gemmatimonadaceae bacterium]
EAVAAGPALVRARRRGVGVRGGVHLAERRRGAARAPGVVAPAGAAGDGARGAGALAQDRALGARARRAALAGHLRAREPGRRLRRGGHAVALGGGAGALPRALGGAGAGGRRARRAVHRAAARAA